MNGVDLIRENDELRATIAVLQSKVMRYEEAIPLGKGHCYHRFTDEGICIRCGEDAEEWDAGCVEEIVEDLQSVTTREFAGALRNMVYTKYTLEDDAIVQKYLDRIEKFAKQWELIESWKERPDVVGVADGADQPDNDGSVGFSITF